MNAANEIKRHFLLGRKAMANLDSILKSRDITLLTKVHILKVMVFPVFTLYRCESWTIKNPEHRRIDTFKLVLEKNLEDELDSKKIKLVNLKGSQP